MNQIFTIIITEVNFKNSENDFLKFKVVTKAQSVNLKGLSFEADKIFKSIEQDIVATNGQIFTLTFNTNKTDSENNFYTELKTLTSTSEQLLIYFNNNLLDFACWFDEPIAKTEIKDFEKLQQTIAALLPNFEISKSCFPSSNIKNNQSLLRTNDGNWLPKPINSSSTGKTTGKNIINVELPKTPTSSENSPLKITEIFPNPPGSDTGKEWIEITNFSSKTQSINYYIIDDIADSGSKPYPIKNQNSLQPGESKVIFSKISKLNLGNSGDSIRFFTPDKKLIEQIDYSEAPENQSYSLLNIDGTEQFSWTPFLTPNQKNPQFTTINGTIIKPADFTNFPYHFIIESEQQKTIITFTEELIKAPLAESLFTLNSTGKFIGILSKEKNLMQLSQFETIPATQQNFWPFIQFSLIILIAVIYLLQKRKIHIKKWKI